MFLFLFSEEEVKKKWRNLRDQFFKELKKIPISKSGEELPYCGKWQHFKSLLFLKDLAVPRDVKENISSTEISNDVYSDKCDNVVNEDQDREEEEMVESFDEALIPLTKIPTSKRKRKRIPEESVPDMEHKFRDYEINKLSLLEDENYLFLKSLLPYFKSMGPIQQLRVRNKFQEILLQEMTSKI